MIPIVRGLYLYDALILGVVLIGIMRRDRVSKRFINYISIVFVLIIFPALLGLVYQALSGYEFTLDSVYLLYNALLSVLYLYYIKGLKGEWVQKNISVITIFLMTPIFISLFMYFPSDLANYLHQFYGVDKLAGSRFGGMWGKNINQLGYIASTMLIWISFLYGRELVGRAFSLFIFIACMVAIFLSGMRTGFVVFFVTILISALFFRESRKVLFDIAVLFIAALIISSLVAGFDFLDASIFKRFSIELFISQLTGESGDGHVGNMYQKWFAIFLNETDLFKILFSFYPEWKYPDSLVIYYFANVGLIGFFSILAFAFYALYSSIKLHSFSLFILFLFSLGMSFKGNFLFNNMSMFLFTLMFFLDDKKTDSRCL